MRAGRAVVAAIAAIGAAMTTAAAACDPNIFVGANASDDSGALEASVAETSLADAADAGDAPVFTPLVVPWSTGFETNGFVDWSLPVNAGYCYENPLGSASFNLVDAGPGSPVHSGLHSALFQAILGDAGDGGVASQPQTRCIRQGALPEAAYYGAWYFIPTLAVTTSNWNLLHFQGANVADPLAAHNLLDVSLVSTPDGGGLIVGTRNYLAGDASFQPGVTIPIGAWFQLEVFFKRAADATGAYTLTVDGQVAVSAVDVVTDDTLWGEWFVGNLIQALAPPSSSVYVDDVTISLTPTAM